MADYIRRDDVYEYLRTQVPLAVFMKRNTGAALESIGRLITEIGDIPAADVIVEHSAEANLAPCDVWDNLLGMEGGD